MKQLSPPLINAVFLIISIAIFSISSNAKNDTCQTFTPSVDYLENIGGNNYIQSYSSKKFNLYLHTISDNNEHARMSNLEINDWMDILYDDFSVGDISFEGDNKIFTKRKLINLQ